MNSPKKQIGLATLGTGATDFYAGELARQFTAAHGNDVAFPVTRIAVDFDPVNACLPDRLDVLSPLVEELFALLESSETDVYVLPNITLHVAIDQLGLPTAMRSRLVHPIENSLAILAAKGFDSMTLAATRHTMQPGPLSAYFDSRGITVKFPRNADIQALDEIRQSVYKTGYCESLEHEMDNLLGNYGNVVIACTELSILNTGNAHLDMARSQVTAALSRLFH